MITYIIALWLAKSEIPVFDQLPITEQICLVLGYQRYGVGWDAGYESDCME